MFDRIGRVSVEGDDPGPEVPHERPGARTQHAASCPNMSVTLQRRVPPEAPGRELIPSLRDANA